MSNIADHPIASQNLSLSPSYLADGFQESKQKLWPLLFIAWLDSLALFISYNESPYQRSKGPGLPVVTCQATRCEGVLTIITQSSDQGYAKASSTELWIQFDLWRFLSQVTTGLMTPMFQFKPHRLTQYNYHPPQKDLLLQVITLTYMRCCTSWPPHFKDTVPSNNDYLSSQPAHSNSLSFSCTHLCTSKCRNPRNGFNQIGVLAKLVICRHLIRSRQAREVVTV